MEVTSIDAIHWVSSDKVSVHISSGKCPLVFPETKRTTNVMKKCFICRSSAKNNNPALLKLHKFKTFNLMGGVLDFPKYNFLAFHHF